MVHRVGRSTQISLNFSPMMPIVVQGQAERAIGAQE